MSKCYSSRERVRVIFLRLQPTPTTGATGRCARRVFGWFKVGSWEQNVRIPALQSRGPGKAQAALEHLRAEKAPQQHYIFFIVWHVIFTILFLSPKLNM